MCASHLQRLYCIAESQEMDLREKISTIIVGIKLLSSGYHFVDIPAVSH